MRRARRARGRVRDPDETWTGTSFPTSEGLSFEQGFDVSAFTFASDAAYGCVSGGQLVESAEVSKKLGRSFSRLERAAQARMASTIHTNPPRLQSIGRANHRTCSRHRRREASSRHRALVAFERRGSRSTRTS